MKKYKLLMVLIVGIVLILGQVGSAFAGTPYMTMTPYDSYDWTPTQSAYEPVRTMIKFGDETLKMPSDLRIGPDGNLYICDMGNKRILVTTKDGAFVKEIGSAKELKSPMGVFVTDNLDVYVADENGRAVTVFDKDGTMIAQYKKPTHPLFGETAPFKPNKVVVDARGNLYISSTGNTNGLVQIAQGENGGEFLGYFGANKTNVSFLTKIRKAIFSDEQLSRTAGIVPTSVVNMSIDNKGMIYTVSRIEGLEALRKLNVAGVNILNNDWYPETPSAVTTSTNGNIYVASKNGYIFEYTSEGDLLFIFGSYDDGQQRKGLFTSVTGIAIDENDSLFVLDEQNGTIEVFEPTEFCDMVHNAFRLFMEGKYTESKEPWTEILRMNSMFSYASVGLGEALYREGDYAQALTAFREGKEYSGYSDAFWEIRSDWLHAHMGTIIVWLFALIVARIILKKLDKKLNFTKPIRHLFKKIKDIKIVSQLSFSFRIIKNPYDAYYGILREGKASFLSGGITLAAFFGLYVTNKYFSGFLFKTVPDGYYNILNDFVTLAAVYLLFIICLYLICTITEGEATFKSVAVGTAYALIPLMLGMVLKVMLSNVLTNNEAFFITLLDVVAYGWTAILLFLMVMFLNDFPIKKTIATILLTAFAALVTVALLFVIYVLIAQLFDFIASIYGEVVYRFVRT